MLEQAKEIGPDFISFIETIKKELLEVVHNKSEKITPGELEKTISQRFSITRKGVRSAIKDLIADNALTYTYHYGRTFIEQSFNKAVRISKHVILKPPELFFEPEPDDVAVEIAHGASFGTGQHPTTRMAIRGTEHVIREIGLLEGKKETCMLDIGTGSGVLAITAVLLGCNTAVGLDIDPCAQYEARENVKINGLEDKIKICNASLEDFNEKFTLITANLRYPTLKILYPAIAKITEPGGAVVVSGIKTDEVPALVGIYTEKYFDCRRKESEKDWACLVFLKTAERVNVPEQ